MFCSGCGKEIAEGSKFCPGCGKAVDGTSNAENVSSDPTKILKEAELRRWDKTFSMTEDAKLSLFCDRLEWNGKKKDIIKIDEIDNVVVGKVDIGKPEPTLEFTDNTGKKRRFFRIQKLGQNVNNALSAAGGQNQDQVAYLTSAQTEMENWRAAIEKLRGRL